MKRFFTNNKKLSLVQQIQRNIVSFFYKRFSVLPHISLIDQNQREDFKIKENNPFKAAKLLKQQIEDLITQKGMDKLKGVRLFDMDSYNLQKAIKVIQYGIAKPQDFTENPISKIMTDDTTYGYFFLTQKGTLQYEVEHNLELQEIARNNSQTEDEYRGLLATFRHYTYELLRNQRFTKRATNLIADYHIDKYTKINLYDIEDDSLFYEAEDAIEVMDALREHYFITHYNNTSIEDLNKFTLEKIQKQVENDNFDGCTINKPAEPVSTIAPVDPEKEETVMPDYIKKMFDQQQAQAEQDRKELAKMIKRIVQAELKKADKLISVKKDVPTEAVKKPTRDQQQNAITKSIKKVNKASHKAGK